MVNRKYFYLICNSEIVVWNVFVRYSCVGIWSIKIWCFIVWILFMCKCYRIRIVVNKKKYFFSWLWVFFLILELFFIWIWERLRNKIRKCYFLLILYLDLIVIYLVINGCVFCVLKELWFICLIKGWKCIVEF